MREGHYYYQHMPVDNCEMEFAWRGGSALSFSPRHVSAFSLPCVLALHPALTLTLALYLASLLFQPRLFTLPHPHPAMSWPSPLHPVLLHPQPPHPLALTLSCSDMRRSLGFWSLVFTFAHTLALPFALVVPVGLDTADAAVVTQLPGGGEPSVLPSSWAQRVQAGANARVAPRLGDAGLASTGSPPALLPAGRLLGAVLPREVGNCGQLLLCYCGRLSCPRNICGPDLTCSCMLRPLMLEDCCI